MARFSKPKSAGRRGGRPSTRGSKPSGEKTRGEKPKTKTASETPGGVDIKKWSRRAAIAGGVGWLGKELLRAAGMADDPIIGGALKAITGVSKGLGGKGLSGSKGKIGGASDFVDASIGGAMSALGGSAGARSAFGGDVESILLEILNVEMAIRSAQDSMLNVAISQSSNLRALGDLVQSGFSSVLSLHADQLSLLSSIDSSTSAVKEKIAPDFVQDTFNGYGGSLVGEGASVAAGGGSSGGGLLGLLKGLLGGAVAVAGAKSIFGGGKEIVDTVVGGKEKSPSIRAARDRAADAAEEADEARRRADEAKERENRLREEAARKKGRSEAAEARARRRRIEADEAKREADEAKKDADRAKKEEKERAEEREKNRKTRTEERKRDEERERKEREEEKRRAEEHADKAKERAERAEERANKAEEHAERAQKSSEEAEKKAERAEKQAERAEKEAKKKEKVWERTEEGQARAENRGKVGRKAADINTGAGNFGTGMAEATALWSAGHVIMKGAEAGAEAVGLDIPDMEDITDDPTALHALEVGKGLGEFAAGAGAVRTAEKVLEKARFAKGVGRKILGPLGVAIEAGMYATDKSPDQWSYSDSLDDLERAGEVFSDFGARTADTWNNAEGTLETLGAMGKIAGDAAVSTLEGGFTAANTVISAPLKLVMNATYDLADEAGLWDYMSEQQQQQFNSFAVASDEASSRAQKNLWVSRLKSAVGDFSSAINPNGGPAMFELGTGEVETGANFWDRNIGGMPRTMKQYGTAVDRTSLSKSDISQMFDRWKKWLVDENSEEDGNKLFLSLVGAISYYRKQNKPGDKEFADDLAKKINSFLKSTKITPEILKKLKTCIGYVNFCKNMAIKAANGDRKALEEIEKLSLDKYNSVISELINGVSVQRSNSEQSAEPASAGVANLDAGEDSAETPEINPETLLKATEWRLAKISENGLEDPFQTIDGVAGQSLTPQEFETLIHQTVENRHFADFGGSSEDGVAAIGIKKITGPDNTANFEMVAPEDGDFVILGREGDITYGQYQKNISSAGHGRFPSYAYGSTESGDIKVSSQSFNPYSNDGESAWTDGLENVESVNLGSQNGLSLTGSSAESNNSDELLNEMSNVSAYNEEMVNLLRQIMLAIRQKNNANNDSIKHETFQMDGGYIR